MSPAVVLDGCVVVTMDAQRGEHAPGHVVVKGERISADHIVEDAEEILAATDTHHDPSPGSMVRIGVAPCSPFSVTEELLTGAAALARRKGVRLHTHLAETVDEDAFCRERFGSSPVDYIDSLGWLGPDVWLAHAVRSCCWCRAGP
jgi:cytosine/adenosine deaminase-related metal-dependent hydrolase